MDENANCDCQMKFTAEELEVKWQEFQHLEVGEDGKLTAGWFIFSAGTEITEIVNWFLAEHNKHCRR